MVRAVVCEEYGPPDSLAAVDVVDPIAGPGEVVVDIAFAAVNYPDVLIIANRYQVSVPTPFVPGSEFSGVVAVVGDGVDSVAVGDRVFGAAMTGAFAERIVVPAAAVRTVPDGVALETVAGFWVAHATAYHAIRSVANVVAGERVVVLGAAGGVGLAAVEIAAVLGADVVAAASTDDKLALCRLHGASHTVNYENGDLRTGLREMFPDGVDVVLDPVGGPLAEQALRALRWKGRFVTIGFASGEIPRIPLNLVLLKGCVVMGFEIRTFSQFEPELAARDERELIELLATGRVVPHVSSVHGLDDAAEALRAVAGRRSTGKVLIRMGG
ncbi:MAG: NADPH:quinone oxidoreductase family protein [Ilumatobacteraceae bacterium]